MTINYWTSEISWNTSNFLEVITNLFNNRHFTSIPNRKIKNRDATQQRRWHGFNQSQRNLGKTRINRFLPRIKPTRYWQCCILWHLFCRILKIERYNAYRFEINDKYNKIFRNSRYNWYTLHQSFLCPPNKTIKIKLTDAKNNQKNDQKRRSFIILERHIS